MKFIFLLLIPLMLHAQEIPKKANTITVDGVTFSQVANQLLDKNYIIDKSDSVLKYIQTARNLIRNTTSHLYMSIYIRIKDSSAIIYALWGFRDYKFLGVPQNDTRVIASDNKHSPFYELNAFALSFGKPVEYSIQ